MGVGHGYSVGTGGHDFFMSVLFRAVFDCLFVDELAAYVSCDLPASLVYMFLPEWIPGYGWLQVGVEWLAHDLLWVVDAFSQVPGAVFSFRFDFPAMLVAYGMLLSILLYGHTGRSRYLLVILFLLLIILLVRVIEDLKQCGI